MTLQIQEDQLWNRRYYMFVNCSWKFRSKERLNVVHSLNHEMQKLQILLYNLNEDWLILLNTLNMFFLLAKLLKGVFLPAIVFNIKALKEFSYGNRTTLISIYFCKEGVNIFCSDLWQVRKDKVRKFILIKSAILITVQQVEYFLTRWGQVILHTSSQSIHYVFCFAYFWFFKLIWKVDSLILVFLFEITFGEEKKLIFSRDLTIILNNIKQLLNKCLKLNHVLAFSLFSLGFLAEIVEEEVDITDGDLLDIYFHEDCVY